MKIAKGLIIVLLATIGGQYGCGTSAEAENLPQADVVVRSDGRTVGELTPAKVKSATAEKPLRIALAAQSRANGEEQWQFVRLYFHQQLEQKPLVIWSESDPAKKVVFWPSFDIGGFHTRVADWSGNLIKNQQNQPINLDLAWTKLLGATSRVKSQEDWLANLAKAGLTLAIVAIPALVAVGAIAVVYVISGVVLRALAGLIWAAFLIGVFAFLAGTVLGWAKGVAPSLNLEAIEAWANRVWTVVRNLLTEVLRSSPTG